VDTERTSEKSSEALLLLGKLLSESGNGEARQVIGVVLDSGTQLLGGSGSAGGALDVRSGG
jgi:hypothetical protein